MNVKKLLSIVGITFMVFLIVGSVAYFAASSPSQELNLLKKDHSFRTAEKINQYPKGHSCNAKCTAEGGFNCGRVSMGCCEDEVSCTTTMFGTKKCQKYKKFDCDLV